MTNNIADINMFSFFLVNSIYIRANKEIDVTPMPLGLYRRYLKVVSGFINDTKLIKFVLSLLPLIKVYTVGKINIIDNKVATTKGSNNFMFFKNKPFILNVLFLKYK
jgi:hypothetical protein